MFPHGCPKDKVKYELAITKAKTGEKMASKNINQ